MIKYMINQFGRPTGAFGSCLAKVMDISNSGMNNVHIKAMSPDLKSILEIGFGSGKTILKAANKCQTADIYGIDISEDMYRKAGALVKDNKRVHLSVGSCEALPYHDEYFDHIYTTDTCYFWNDPDKAMSEIVRVLKKGAKFSNIYNSMYAKSISAMSQDNRLYTDDRMISTAEKYGLKCIRCSRLGIFEHVQIFRKIGNE